MLKILGQVPVQMISEAIPDYNDGAMPDPIEIQLVEKYSPSQNNANPFEPYVLTIQTVNDTYQVNLADLYRLIEDKCELGNILTPSLVTILGPYPYLAPSHTLEDCMVSLSHYTCRLLQAGFHVTSPYAMKHTLREYEANTPINEDYWEQLVYRHLQLSDTLIIYTYDGWTRDSALQNYATYFTGHNNNNKVRRRIQYHDPLLPPWLNFLIHESEATAERLFDCDTMAEVDFVEDDQWDFVKKAIVPTLQKRLVATLRQVHYPLPDTFLVKEEFEA